MNAVHVDADREVRGLGAHVLAVVDLHDESVEVDHRIGRFHRPVLSGEDFVGDLIDDLRERLA